MDDIVLTRTATEDADLSNEALRQLGFARFNLSLFVNEMELLEKIDEVDGRHYVRTTLASVKAAIQVLESEEQRS